ncbi:Guanosine-3',5'-bis(Diphosphate) 3'-pyrophosphohydrolase [uncultured Leptolyngbya sp.]|uniref:Guanosine-3',5'-bis(Diphosphate) 3'-pyrophosphohydrolase n=1 Tax=uncultured Leptolyngbya sp. TaxID=332963 RepID=A0A6J4NT71_9CYAN|nr:Guanosine-3',5'-bis(Diphosphate) 3'-pyrophosphohydrolase [uncultured Leptolyngbya sp.]
MGLSLNQLLGRAVAIAATAHQNQLDKANAPYILHPLRLLLRGQTPLEQIVAVLHDVVEDSDWTLEQLAAEGFPSEVIAALDCLTRRSDESYNEFIDRVLTNSLAMRVKRYDLEDNMTLTRMTVLTAKDTERLQRYHSVYQRLLKALEA